MNTPFYTAAPLIRLETTGEESSQQPHSENTPPPTKHVMLLPRHHAVP